MSADGLLDHCLEMLASVGSPRARRMFGGQGLYVDELFIALIAGDRLYFKTDAQTLERFQAAGSQPFCFDTRGRSVETSYWSAPEEAMDSPAGMRPWAKLAMEAALRARAAKPAPRKKVKPPAAAAPDAAGSSRSASPPPPRHRRRAG